MKIPMGVPPWGREEYLSVLSTLWGRRDVVSEVERQICKTFGVKYCVFTDLGRQAIYLALKGLNIGSDDGVIIPSYVCQSVILPIIAVGAEPQFVDIEDDLNISPDSVKKRIDKKTRAILVPHMYGKMAKIEKIQQIAKEHGLALIDDAAQAVGAKRRGKYAGTFGDVGIFSFGPFKSLIATRGGALITNNEKLWHKIKSWLPLPNPASNQYFRFLKSIIKFKFRRVSYLLVSRIREHDKQTGTRKHKVMINLSEIDPFRGDALDGAIVVELLQKLDSILIRRRNCAKELSSLLGRLELFKVQDSFDENNVFTKFVVRISSKVNNHHFGKQLIGYLRINGIEAHGGYKPLHMDPRFSKYTVSEMEQTSNIYENVICIPMSSEMRYENVEYLASMLKNFIKSNA